MDLITLSRQTCAGTREVIEVGRSLHILEQLVRRYVEGDRNCF